MAAKAPSLTKETGGKSATENNSDNDDAACPQAPEVNKALSRSGSSDGQAGGGNRGGGGGLSGQGGSNGEPRGTPLDRFNKLKPYSGHVVSCKAVEHKLLFPCGSSGESREIWDPYHVRMPYTHSPKERGPRYRWDTIKSALCGSVSLHHGSDLVDLILLYNESYKFKWTFGTLIEFIGRLTGKEKDDIFCTIDRMAELALKLPQICPIPIPLLLRRSQISQTLSQRQIACLLCHAFFCTFPSRNADPTANRSASRYSSTQGSGPVLPSINFSGLFRDMFDRKDAQFNKLQCLFHYFSRVTSDKPSGNVTFERQSVQHDEEPNWEESRKRFTRLHVRCGGSIEDDGNGLLQVDFANKLVGGGVIGRGCVQEEIRFIICPELIAARLFTEELSENEVLIITGAERYSTYTGYGNTFEFKGNYEDSTERDEFGRKLTQIVAMDAKKFRDEDQFEERWVKRELLKAYCGFWLKRPHAAENLPGVVTGNWGCGAFNGDRHLKSLIQLMAAAEAGRDICYITIDDPHLVKQLDQIHTFITSHNLTVGDVYSLICQYREYRKRHKGSTVMLYDYILKTYVNNVSNHDSNSSTNKPSSSSNSNL